MLQYGTIDISEGIDIIKSNKLKKSYASDGCHDLSMMVYELENIAKLNVKDVDYRCILWNLTKNDPIDRSNNSKLVIRVHYEYGFWCE